MRRSEALLFTRRDAGGHDDPTVELTVRAGIARRTASGLYALGPVGERILARLRRLLAAEMDAVGGQRVSLPALSTADVWRASGRWDGFEGEMFTLEDRDGRELCLAPSHEEGIVRLVEGAVRSTADLPALLYQIGPKHRDDRPRAGLLRTREFTMKDAYSLHATRESLAETYGAVRAAYGRILERLELEYVVAPADDSVMGGGRSAEFLALADDGTVAVGACTAADCRVGITDESPGPDLATAEACPECGAALADREAIEVGHVFQLGTRYSDALDLTVDDADGDTRAVLMGSYGIGLERLVHAIIAQHADADGCRWPGGAIAPFDAAIVPLADEDDLRTAADRLYDRLGREGVLLFDDPDRTIGERFAESDLLGIPAKVVLGNHYRETGEVEVEARDGGTSSIPLEDVPSHVSAGD